MTQPNAQTTTIDFSNGSHLTCTPDHPVFVAGRGFVAAALLANGDTVRGVSAPVRVAQVSENTKREPVYNLTVEGEPEFFANGVLVHNCDEARYLLWIGRNGF